MKLFVCTDHKGHAGGATLLVLAKSKLEARPILDAALEEIQDEGHPPYELKEININRAAAYILDGNHTNHI